MSEFVLDLSTKVYFGNNITDKAVREEKRWIKGNVLLVTTGRTLIKNGYVEHLVNLISANPEVNKVIIYDRCSANPRLTEIREAVAMGKENQIDCVIGFGGGSAIDAAKAAAVGIGSEVSLESYLLDGIVPGKNTLPIIAIPTTAGSGSELSKGAIISSPEHQIKAGIRGEAILPKVAIVNPVYTWSVPIKVTLETGFDVLAHAIESFVAVKANPFSEMLSEKAIKIAAKNLLIFVNDLNNHAAREAMSYASMLMGMNLASVGTCLPHRMQYAIGAATDTSHSAGLIAIYPSWIEHEYIVNSTKIKSVLYWLTGQQVMGAKEAGNCFRAFMEEIQLMYSLENLGIKESDLLPLIEAVTGNLVNDRLSEQCGIISLIFSES